MVLLKSGRVSLEMTKTKMLPRPLYLGLSRHTWALGLPVTLGLLGCPVTLGLQTFVTLGAPQN